MLLSLIGSDGRERVRSVDNLLCINAMCVRFHGLVHGVKIVSITVNWFEAFCGLKVGS